jgi:benzodiazapine receptor
MSWMEWYNSLVKPEWTPEPATIGLIWQILYPIIAVTFLFVLVQAFRRKVPWKVTLPFVINLAANIAFTPIQFGLRSLIIWMMIAIWQYYRWVAIAQVPYLVWVSIATTLQLAISFSN